MNFTKLDMEYATIFTAFNSADAQLVRSRLEAVGFHPFILNKNSAPGCDGCTLADGVILIACGWNHKVALSANAR